MYLKKGHPPVATADPAFPMEAQIDDEAGETYWKISNGIRLTGMPSYQKILSETEMWEIALLLKNADKQLPASVTAILFTIGEVDEMLTG